MMNLQAPNPSGQPAIPEIRDIAPPVDVFPWPLWLVIAVAVIGLIIVAGIVTGLIVAARNRPKGPPPTPRSIALSELEDLRLQVDQMAPYDFSIRVSDVLRSYIAAQYKLKVTKQTSPEFLASITYVKKFSDADRELLEQFLERSDLIKFAHIDATCEDSRILLERALAFVHGGSR